MKPNSPIKLILLSALTASCILFYAFNKQQLTPEVDFYKFSISKKGKMIDNATCYAWIPENLKTVRCVLVHLHGCTREGDAKEMMHDIQWKELARKHGAVLLSPEFISGGNSTACANWYIPANGSDSVFIEMLDTLSRRSGHTEISRVPWALWGHSGGSMWATAMTGKYPTRVAVTVAQSCGVDISDVPEALKVPVLHHNGIQDICKFNGSLFSKGRQKGALWAYAVNPVVESAMDGHQVHDMRLLAIPWIDAVLDIRLPKIPGTVQLRPVDTSNTWLGDTTNIAIAPAASFKNNKMAACWFPNQKLAQNWAEYMKKGTVTDLTPPFPPFSLSLERRENLLTIKWDARADLESGIKTFAVYRNGKQIKRLEYHTKTRYSNQTGYQRWNDGDQPSPAPAPPMAFTDTIATTNGIYTYEITTINWSAAESKKSKKISIHL